jgi:hypothetical protein
MKEDLVWLKRRGCSPSAPQLHELSQTACMTMLSKLEPPRGIGYFRMQGLNHLKRQLAEAASPPPALRAQQQFGISTPSHVLAAAAAVAVVPGQEAWQQPVSPFVSQSSLCDAASASPGWHSTGSTAPPSTASAEVAAAAAAAPAPELPLLRNALASPTPAAARPSTSCGNRSQQLFDSSSQAVRPKTASSQPHAPSQRSTQSSQAAAKRPRHSSPPRPVGQVHVRLFHI